MTIFGTHSATRVKDFLYLIFCSGTQRCIFLVLCYIALPVRRSKDCLSSCIQSAGKTVAGRTTSHVSQLYGLRNDVLLVSRVYLCKNKLQILSHDSGIICQIKGEFLLPFVLCHISLVTPTLWHRTNGGTTRTSRTTRTRRAKRTTRTTRTKRTTGTTRTMTTTRPISKNQENYENHLRATVLMFI